MAYGLQTFKVDGSVDFDSNSSHNMRVIHKQTVTGNTSIAIQNYPPPYFVILMTQFTTGLGHQLYVSPISYSQSGNTVSVVYRPFSLNGQDSLNLPTIVMVCK